MSYNVKNDRSIQAHVTEVDEIPGPSSSRWSENDFVKIEASSFQDFDDYGSEYLPSDVEESLTSFSSNADSTVVQFIEKTTVTKSNLNSEDEYQELQSEEEKENNIEIENETKNVQIIALDLISETDRKHNAFEKEQVNNFNQQVKNVSVNSDLYGKKQYSSQRSIICPICFKDVITHFTRHLIRHHPKHKDVLLLKQLKPRSKQRLELVASLRKQGYFHLNNKKGVLNPVRKSNNPNVNHFLCTFCLGYYSKKNLHKHVKICKKRPSDVTRPGKQCLSKSQTFTSSLIYKNYDFLKNSRLKTDVFDLMRPDEISSTAKNDPLICLYGETLLNKLKGQQITNVISNKMREMSRLLLALRSIDNGIMSLFDALKPEFFQTLVSASKIISGYNFELKRFKAPSLVLYMGTNLKMLCDVALKLVMKKRNIPNIKWKNGTQKQIEIKELKKLIDGHWCNELFSFASKNLNEKHLEKPMEVLAISDILALQTYVNTRSDVAYDNLCNENSSIYENYKILTECVLALTIMFNHKYVGDVQYLKIDHYNEFKDSLKEETFRTSFTPVEKILTEKFKMVVTGRKGYKPVPILFSNKTQKLIKCLIEIRLTTSVVPKSNPYLFANPGSEKRWMNGANVTRKLIQNCGAKNSTLLISTKFRKHIATILQLMSIENNEMEQVATFIGHTKEIPKEFSKLPQDIYQSAKVAKILLLLEKGKGKQFKGKNLNGIELKGDIYYSSESGNSDEEEDSIPIAQLALKRVATAFQYNKISKNFVQEEERNLTEEEDVNFNLEESIINGEKSKNKKDTCEEIE